MHDEQGREAVDTGTPGAPQEEPRPDEPASPEPATHADDDSLFAFLRELPVLLLVAFLLAFLLRTFVVQVFYIPSESMAPTLQVNDRMVVEKLSYRFRDPQRGEIVVFKGDDSTLQPVDESAVERVVRGLGQFLGVVPANARDFVKRVIGVPGDEVRIEEGRVLVNGSPIDEPYVRFPDERSHGPFEVPEGKLFFLGDNRPNSSDSRFSLGFVDQDQVVGRALVVIWPIDHAGLLDDADYDVPSESVQPSVRVPAA